MQHNLPSKPLKPLQVSLRCTRESTLSLVCGFSPIHTNVCVRLCGCHVSCKNLVVMTLIGSIPLGTAMLLMEGLIATS